MCNSHEWNKQREGQEIHCFLSLVRAHREERSWRRRLRCRGWDCRFEGQGNPFLPVGLYGFLYFLFIYSQGGVTCLVSTPPPPRLRLMLHLRKVSPFVGCLKVGTFVSRACTQLNPYLRRLSLNPERLCDSPRHFFEVRYYQGLIY